MWKVGEAIKEPQSEADCEIIVMLREDYMGEEPWKILDPGPR